MASNKRAKVVPGQNCAGDESDPLLGEIAQSLADTEKTSPIVSDKLGKIVNLRWLNKLNGTNLREKSEKYLHPINCDRLITPKVISEIWGCLDQQTRGKDLKL